MSALDQSAAPRVVIADDAILIREGLRGLLEAGGCEVVASVGDPVSLQRALATLGDVDAVVLDIRMPPTHTDEGMRVLENMRGEGSTVGVLLLSMYASPQLAMRALACGPGTGYLTKENVTTGTSLVTAVRTVMTGGTVVDPEVVRHLIAAPPSGVAAAGLTEREHEILSMMAEGRSNAGIADQLVLSLKTVESHVDHIMAKLGIESTRAEHRRVLAVLAALQGT